MEDFADNLGLLPTDELDENAFATLLSVGFEQWPLIATPMGPAI